MVPERGNTLFSFWDHNYFSTCDTTQLNRLVDPHLLCVVDFLWEDGRGLCYGNGGSFLTYLVLIMGIICVLHHPFTGGKYWCSNLIGWRVFVWCKRVANADCLNKFSFLFLRGQVMGGWYLRFSSVEECVLGNQACRDVNILCLLLCFSL